MIDLDFKLVGYKKTKQRRTIQDRSFARQMQKEMGGFLDLVRIRAESLIIKNTTGYRNPRRARKKQPSKPGMLTSRTGKLAFLTRYKAKKGTGDGFENLGRIIAKKITPALQMRIRNLKVGGLRDRKFEGTIKSKITSLPRQVTWTGNKGDRMPIENSATISARFLHEARGRKIFEPAYKDEQYKLVKRIRNLVRKVYHKEI